MSNSEESGAVEGEKPVEERIADALKSGNFKEVARLAQEAEASAASGGSVNESTPPAGSAESAKDVQAQELVAEQERQNAQQIAEIRAKLQGDEGVSVPAEQLSGEVPATADAPAEATVENTAPERSVEERIGTPKTEMFQQYGEKMRASADELVSVMSRWRAKEAEIHSPEAQSLGYETPEFKKLLAEERALNDERNKLEDALFGIGVIKYRRQNSGEDWSAYHNYKQGEHEKYSQTALSDPRIGLRLAEAGRLGRGEYHEGEGIGRLSQELRSDPEYMAKILDSLSREGAEAFWPHVRGAASSKELYLAAVQKNHLNYQWGRKEWTSDPEVQKVALESGLDPIYLRK